ncbi:MAG: ATP-binding protein [Candidatus Kapaibacteriales bacterium]
MKKLIFSFVIILLTNCLVYTQNDRKVLLDFIKLNGILLEEDKLDFLVISRKDSISFFYHLDVKDTNRRTAFLFKITIKNSKDSSFFTTNLKNVNYKNLPEDDYTFRIEAFDPRNKWSATPLEIKFKVDDKVSNLCKELRDLKKKVAKTTLISDSKQSDTKNRKFDLKSLAIGFIAGFFLLFIINTITRKKNNSKTKGKIPPGNYGDVVALDKIKYEQILLENSNLRAEISALRGQIDALNSRAEELRKQNLELKDKVDKLSRSKSEIEELQQQKDELFALIIHDIKNPAALIKNLVELLRSYDLTATEQQEIIEDILDTSNRIVSLSQEVSRILALESTLMTLNLQTASINEIVKDVVLSNSSNAKTKNIGIFIDTDESIQEFKMDKYKVYEVLDNLVSNAIKFTQRGGEVRISTKKELDKVLVEVKDNGLGMSEDDINRAFQRGARLSTQPTGGEPSSGLGLWIVKKLVETMKGKVWVRSALGKGSTFSFYIPIVEESSEPVTIQSNIQNTSQN